MSKVQSDIEYLYENRNISKNKLINQLHKISQKLIVLFDIKFQCTVPRVVVNCE